jgi:hypothetical protein
MTDNRRWYWKEKYYIGKFNFSSMEELVYFKTCEAIACFLRWLR